MKTYWDSSALIEALHNANIRDRIKPDQNASRLHSLAEVFSTLTKGVNYRYSPSDAANMVEDLAKDLVFVELVASEALKALKQASSLGVRGGRIHDLMHAVAAEKFEADVLLTLDNAGFTTLNLKMRVESP
jgi:predicted nucleic acid-binding protein